MSPTMFAAERDRFEGLGVHEDEVVAVLVRVVVVLRVEVHDVDLVVRVDALVGDRAGREVLQLEVQDRPPVPRRVQVAVEAVEERPVHVQDHAPPNVDHLR